MKHYRVAFSSTLDEELNKLSSSLQTDAAEVIYKAITLLKHAVKADEILLMHNGKSQRVLIK